MNEIKLHDILLLSKAEIKKFVIKDLLPLNKEHIAVDVNSLVDTRSHSISKEESLIYLIKSNLKYAEDKLSKLEYQEYKESLYSYIKNELNRYDEFNFFDNIFFDSNSELYNFSETLSFFVKGIINQWHKYIKVDFDNISSESMSERKMEKLHITISKNLLNKYISICEIGKLIYGDITFSKKFTKEICKQQNIEFSDIDYDSYKSVFDLIGEFIPKSVYRIIESTLTTNNGSSEQTVKVESEYKLPDIESYSEEVSEVLDNLLVLIKNNKPTQENVLKFKEILFNTKYSPNLDNTACMAVHFKIITGMLFNDDVLPSNVAKEWLFKLFTEINKELV